MSARQRQFTISLSAEEGSLLQACKEAWIRHRGGIDWGAFLTACVLATVENYDLLLAVPVRLVLHCPRCKLRHVDKGQWAKREHQTHLCDGCGLEWRPHSFPTVGIAA